MFESLWQGLGVISMVSARVAWLHSPGTHSEAYSP
jgi:hypothetical protein